MTSASETASTAVATSDNISVVLPLREFNRGQKPVAEDIVKALQGKENIDIKITRDSIVYRGLTLQMHKSLERLFQELIPQIKDNKDFNVTQIRSLFKSVYDSVKRETDPKVINRLQKAATRKEDARRKAEEATARPKPITSVAEEIGNGIVPYADILALRMARSPRTVSALGEFKELDVFDLHAKDKKLVVLFPFYEDTEYSDYQRQHIIRALAKVAADVKDPVSGRHLTHETVKRAIKATHTAPATPKTVPAKTADKSQPHTTIKITEVDGRSIVQWAEDVDQAGRSATLQAFGANPNLGFHVNLSKSQGKVDGLNVRFDKGGILPAADIKLASYFISEVQKKWMKSPNANKAMVGDWIKQIWTEVDRSSEAEHGDHLKLVFDRSAQKPAEAASLNASFKDATAKLERGGITPKMNFTLPLFGKDGALHFKRESGVSEELMPTANQAKLMNSIRDPAYPYTVVQGPVGTGKTLWACYAALQLLQQGHIFKIYYDRPLEGAGGAKIGYLKGDLDDKMGPYHGPFEKAFSKILGEGNIAAGQAKFKEMTEAGIIERYDQIFQRGDTAEDALLIIDEAQNKTRDEIYHLITRPDANSKLLLMGDGEFQVDFKDKSASGLREMPEIYGHIEQFAFVALDENDIKRSPTIQKIYVARRDFEAAEKGAREARFAARPAPATVAETPRGPV